MAENPSTDDDGPAERNATHDDRYAGTPGGGRTPTAHEIEASAPAEFGLVQAWWGDGKGKTTAALGMGFRAAGHGYRVHLLQFMKGGATSVADVRGEYNAIAAVPGFTFENAGHYGWHGLRDGSDDEAHEAEARAGLKRAKSVLDAAHDVDGAVPLDGPPSKGVHMLILDEILYAVEHGLLDEGDVLELVRTKPADLELVLTGSHTRPTYLTDRADLLTHVEKEAHPIDDGQRARRGTEF